MSIGDITEGSDEAQILLRAYGQNVRQLLRASNWAFARKQVPLVLLGDRTGQTPNVGTLVQYPWRFAYEYPPDAMRVRLIPWSRQDLYSPPPPGNTAIPNTPLTTGAQQPANFGQRLIPSRFLVGNDPNYPPQPGQIWWEVQGMSPTGRVVIMSNVPCAHVVYTFFTPYPSVWDSLFRAGLVAYLASEIALPIWAKRGDVKTGMAIRGQQIAIVKAKIEEARIADGNEGFFSSDIFTDWMRVRKVGGFREGWGDSGVTVTEGYGILSEGYGSCSFADGTAY